MIIFIDAGHGGKDPGAVYGERMEKHDNLRMALRVGELLTAEGAQVHYSRTDDTFVGLTKRAQMANQVSAELFISFHRNAATGSARGAEVLVYRASGKIKETAEYLSNLYQSTGFRNRGVKERPGLAVLNKTAMPAMLPEIGFLDHPEDNSLFDTNFEELARNTTQAILSHFDKKPSFSQDPSPATGWVMENGFHKYILEDGSPAQNGWFEIDSKQYLFDQNGHMMTGWQQWEDQWYYLLPDTGFMMTGFVLLDGYTYYLNSDGSMLTEAKVFTPDASGRLF